MTKIETLKTSRASIRVLEAPPKVIEPRAEVIFEVGAVRATFVSLQHEQTLRLLMRLLQVLEDM